MEYKLMVVGAQSEIIWNMISEKEIPLNNDVYIKINKEINLNEWQNKFNNLYTQWLNEDVEFIFDIFNPINTDILSAISRYNKNSDSKLYYWFDVNRDNYPDFKWEYCPITGERLILLSEAYHSNNRLVSPNEPLVFPFTE